MKNSSTQKEVATKSNVTNLPVNRGSLLKGIAAAKDISPGGGVNADIMKVTTDGQVVMGMDAEPVESTEKWLVNPSLIMLGYICWKEGKPIDQKHRSLIELGEHAAYTLDDLTDHGPYTSEMDGWAEQYVMGLVSKADGLKTVFPATALGGRQAIQKLIDAIGKQDEDGSDYIYPVVTVTADHYFNKKFRKDIYFPVFDVVGWENEAGESEDVADEGGAE